MKPIKKDELFHSLGGFLKSKGIELNDGQYTARIQKGCNLISDAINGTQQTVKQTKAQVDQALDKLRQTIHESTAPAPPPEPPKTTQTKTGAKKPKAPSGPRRSKAKTKS